MSSTIKDVAKMAGVSISTVSKFINGGNVLEENRTQIEQAIETLNYQVNTVARGMKTRKTMSVGVLIPSLADYYGVSILSYIDQELYAAGYSTIICDYNQSDPAGASDKINFLINKQIDGIIMQPMNVRQEDIDRAAKAKAYMEGRDYVTGGDVRAVFHDVCAHRVLLKDNAGETTAEQVLDELLKETQNPDRRVLFPGIGKP